MMVDREKLESFKDRLRDRYTPEELCELLGLTEDDLLEMFEDRLMEIHIES